MKKYKFEIREIDALVEDYFENMPIWYWNSSYHIGEFETSAKNEKKAFTAALKRIAGITFKRNRTIIDYDGSVYEILDRKTKMPLYAAIPMF